MGRQMELTQSANKSVNTNLVSIRSDKVKKFMAGVALSFAAIAANAADYKFDTAHTQIFLIQHKRNYYKLNWWTRQLEKKRRQIKPNGEEVPRLQKTQRKATSEKRQKTKET